MKTLDLAVIGNCTLGALIDAYANITWGCFPRFDGDPTGSPYWWVRWLTREEAARLIAELPEHLAAMARFSLGTGLRKSNVTELQRSQVDLGVRQAWIHPDQAKARKAPLRGPGSQRFVGTICGTLG